MQVRVTIDTKLAARGAVRTQNGTPTNKKAPSCPYPRSQFPGARAGLCLCWRTPICATILLFFEMVCGLASRTFMPRAITRRTVEIFHQLILIQKAYFCRAISVTTAWTVAVRGRDSHLRTAPPVSAFVQAESADRGGSAAGPTYLFPSRQARGVTSPGSSYSLYKTNRSASIARCRHQANCARGWGMQSYRLLI